MHGSPAPPRPYSVRMQRPILLAPRHPLNLGSNVAHHYSWKNYHKAQTVVTSDHAAVPSEALRPVSAPLTAGQGA